MRIIPKRRPFRTRQDRPSGRSVPDPVIRDCYIRRDDSTSPGPRGASPRLPASAEVPKRAVAVAGGWRGQRIIAAAYEHALAAVSASASRVPSFGGHQKPSSIRDPGPARRSSLRERGPVAPSTSLFAIPLEEGGESMTRHRPPRARHRHPDLVAEGGRRSRRTTSRSVRWTRPYNIRRVTGDRRGDGSVRRPKSEASRIVSSGATFRM